MAESELRVDALLDGLQSKLLEPLDVDAGERLELEIGQRPSLPQRLGRAQRLRGRQRIPGRERLAPLDHQPLEELQVELARLDPKQIARCARN